MSKGIKFPRTLYRVGPGGTEELVTGGKHYRYDSLIVYNEKELEAGEEIGFVDSFQDALFGIAPEPKKQNKRQKAAEVKETDPPDEDGGESDPPNEDDVANEEF